MIAAFPPLPPVIDQTIQTTPLTAAGALCFVAITVVAAYVAWRRSAWIASALAFFVPFAAYRDVWHTTITIEKCLVFGAVLGLLVGGAPLVPQSRGARRILWVAVAMLVAISLSTLNAVYHGNAAREFFKQTEYLMLFWCAATFVERIPRAPLHFIYGAALSACIVSTLAVSEAILGGAPSGIWVNGHPVPRVTGPPRAQTSWQVTSSSSSDPMDLSARELCVWTAPFRRNGGFCRSDGPDAVAGRPACRGSLLCRVMAIAAWRCAGCGVADGDWHGFGICR